MIDFAKRWLARALFYWNRDEVYNSLIRSMEQGGSERTPLLTALFQMKGDRAAERNSAIAIAHYGIKNRLDSGLTLAEAMRPVIPVDEAMMIDSGEANGRIVEALRSASHAKSVSKQIGAVVRAALAEPVMAACSMLLTSVVMGAFIWPQYLATTPRQYWDAWAYLIFDLQIKSAKYWPATCIVFVLVGLYRWSLPRLTGPVRKLLDRIPPWSTYRDARATSVFVTLGALIEAGLTIDQALARISRESNRYMQWHLEAIRLRYEGDPSKPIQALDTGLFSKRMLDLVAEAATQRSFDATLQHVGRQSMDEIVKSVKLTAWLANGFFLAIIFSFLIWLTFAIVVGSMDATERQTRQEAGSAYSSQ